MSAAVWLLKHWKAFAAVAVVGAMFGLGWHFGGLEAGRDLAEQRAEWSRLAQEGAAEALERQQALQNDVDTARGQLDEQRRTIAAQASRIAVLSVDADRLRGKLASFAAGRSGQDTVAACQSRAGALANLLAEGAGLLAEGANLYRECSIAHDQRAAEVKALLAGWPSAEDR